MEKAVSDELYIRFGNNKSKIYSQFPLSNPKDSPTEESFIRENLSVIRDRAAAFRQTMSEIVKFEKEDIQTRWKILIVGTIAGLVTWGVYVLCQYIDSAMLPMPAFFTALMGVIIILNLVISERPFSFIHRQQNPAPFRLQKALEKDVRVAFRKRLKLTESPTVKV